MVFCFQFIRITTTAVYQITTSSSSTTVLLVVVLVRVILVTNSQSQDTKIDWLIHSSPCTRRSFLRTSNHLKTRTLISGFYYKIITKDFYWFPIIPFTTTFNKPWNSLLLDNHFKKSHKIITTDCTCGPWRSDPISEVATMSFSNTHC